MTMGNESKTAGTFLPAQSGLNGELRVPGDKSVSHRALLLGAVNSGPVVVTGFLRAADTLATLRAVRALGVRVDEDGERLVVHGQGWEGLQEPEDVIDVGNSGTLIRLLPGLVAGRGFLCVLTGDASIRRRPMDRVLRPLAAMGVQVAGRQGNTLPPITVRGQALRGITYRLPVASAQVKSCLLLAGLQAEGETTLLEPSASRDHTERLLSHAGAPVRREPCPKGEVVVQVERAAELRLSNVQVPGDFSSAAFFVVAALLVPNSCVRLLEVGLNPTRTGLLSVLERMGAQVGVEVTDKSGPEPRGNVVAYSSELVATSIEEGEVPLLIDELPLFLLAAARARGTSRLRGAAELRTKESDRLRAMSIFLRSLGVQVTEYPDGLDVVGRPEGWESGNMKTEGDHRLAMVGAVAGAASRGGVVVDDLACIAVSYPGFLEAYESLGGTCLRGS